MLFKVGQLAGKRQRIERGVSFHATPVQERHHLGQVGPVEIVGANPRVMALKAEVDGIGAVFDGGDQAVAITGRRQQLGPGSHARKSRLLAPLAAVAVPSVLLVGCKVSITGAAFNGRVVHGFQRGQSIEFSENHENRHPFLDFAGQWWPCRRHAMEKVVLPETLESLAWVTLRTSAPPLPNVTPPRKCVNRRRQS